MTTRFISFILAVILVFSFAVPAMAAENNTNAIVGILTLYAGNSGQVDWTIDLGHVFLEFYNTSGQTQYFGYYAVPAHSGVTVSIWNNINDKQGIIYNADSYLHYEKGRYANRVSLTITVTSSDLDIISDYLTDSSNDWYNLATYNCVDFCLDIWYSVCDWYSFSTASPSSPRVLYNSIIQFYDHEVNVQIVSNDTVGYYENGSWVTIPHTALNNNVWLGIEEPSEPPVTE